MKMLTGTISDKFVCMDDITGQPEEMNYVIYNPLHDTATEASTKLFERIKEKFNVELTSVELLRLISYDVYNLSEFVNDLRSIIYDHKK